MAQKPFAKIVCGCSMRLQEQLKLKCKRISTARRVNELVGLKFHYLQ